MAKEFPGKLVGLYAYREHGEPSSFKLEPNVYVQITPVLFLSPNRTKDVNVEWAEKCSNLGRYDYYQVYQWNLDGLQARTSRRSLIWSRASPTMWPRTRPL